MTIFYKTHLPELHNSKVGGIKTVVTSLVKNDSKSVISGTGLTKLTHSLSVNNQLLNDKSKLSNYFQKTPFEWLFLKKILAPLG